jgi:hypothetical protein
LQIGKRRESKRILVLQKILDESLHQGDPEAQGIVKSFHIFPEGGLFSDPDLQSVALAKLADPPEKVALQELLYFRDLLFPAPGADDFSYNLHPDKVLVP